MFKLKPNHKLGVGNHLIYYNRFDGAVCLETTSHIIEYNALEYCLLYAPLLVIHKRHDMLQHTANICVDTEFNLSLLHRIIIPNYSTSLSVRQLDLSAIKTNRIGLVTHNGQLNSKFIIEEKEVPLNAKRSEAELSADLVVKYRVGTLTTQSSPEINIDQPDMHIVDLLCNFENLQLSLHKKPKEVTTTTTTPFFGTLFSIWPSYLFRRNWFTALGNQREHGGWIGACRRWINESAFPSPLQDYLYKTWVPSEYHYLFGSQTQDGIPPSALHAKQLKFILVNTRLMKEKFTFEMSEEELNESDLLKDDFIPMLRVNKNPKIKIK